MMATSRINDKDSNTAALRHEISKADKDHPVVLWSRNLWEGNGDEVVIQIITGLKPGNDEEFCYLVAGKEGKKADTSYARIDKLLAKRDVKLFRSWADIHLLVKQE
jgi:hypothetical protein